MPFKAKIFNIDTWVESCVELFQSEIEGLLATKGECSVVLTGGKSVAGIYDHWSQSSRFHSLQNVSFYLSDERLVGDVDCDSNYRLLMTSLFKEGIPSKCKFFKMYDPCDGEELSAARYELILPNKIDFLLLSVAMDGHIASLFPGNKPIKNYGEKIYLVHDENHMHRRITISPMAINSANLIYALALGPSKCFIYESAKASSTTYCEVPAKLTLRGTWLFADYSRKL